MYRPGSGQSVIIPSLVFWAAAAINSCFAAEGAAEKLFDSRADHPWNALHDALWLRNGADDAVYGRGRLDPLLWAHTQHLTTAKSAQLALQRLDEFLRLREPRLKKPLLKRLILQRDLWAVFDWLANREHEDEQLSSRPIDKAIRRQLRAKLALAIQRLAFERDEGQQLPRAYQLAVQSDRFAREFDDHHWQRPFLPPRLLDPSGPWVGLGTADGPIAPAHLRGRTAFSRSAFTVFLRLPGGRRQTIEYLQRLRQFPSPWVREQTSQGSARMIPNPATPQFPPGTQVALIRRMLRIDKSGRITPTPIVEQLQIRVHRRIERIPPGRKATSDPAQAFFEFVLDRRQLIDGTAGGLRAVKPAERDFGPIPFSHGIDLIDEHARAKKEDEAMAGRSPRMPTVLQSCVGCHQDAGVLSLNSYTRQFGPRSLRPPAFFTTGTARADQMSVIAKRQRYDWGLLMGLWAAGQ